MFTPPVKDITGRQFGRLTVLRRAGRNKHEQILWACQCSCGEITVVPGYCLKGGNTRSCGCLMRETAATVVRQRSVTHGMSGSPEYRCWESMIRRCTNPKDGSYDNYGGRGISVCSQWLGSFEAFFSDVGLKPSPDHTLDRFPDVNGNYEPGNVRWATRTDQARNRRSNRIVEVAGAKMSLAEATERAGVNYHSAKKKLNRGMTMDAVAVGDAANEGDVRHG